MAKFSFLGSEEKLEMIFDWVDVEQKGRLSLEEFSSGLSMFVLGGPLGAFYPARQTSQAACLAQGGWADRKCNRVPPQHPQEPFRACMVVWFILVMRI